MKLTSEQFSAVDKALDECECLILVTDKTIMMIGSKEKVLTALQGAVKNDEVFGNVVGAAHHLLAATIFNETPPGHIKDTDSGGNGCVSKIVIEKEDPPCNS